MSKYPAIAELVREADRPSTEEDLARRLARRFRDYERPEGRVRQFFFEVRNRERDHLPPYDGDIIGIGPKDSVGASTALWVRGRPLPVGAAPTPASQASTTPAPRGSPQQPSAPRTPASKGGGVTFDEVRTAERMARLNAYIEGNVLDGERFICTSASGCRASVPGCNFFEGQMAHVGRRYDAHQGATPLRIVVIGMSYGHGPPHVSFAARSAMFQADAARRLPRTPHMRGTVLALKSIFGLDTATTSPASECIGGVGAHNHLYESCALVNALLCSATATGDGKKDRASPRMKTDCRRHLIETLRILEPTIVILQGKPPQEAVASVMTPIAQHLSRLTLGDTEAIACRFSHPSAWGPAGWSRADAPYFREVVVPTLDEATARLGRTGG